MKFVARISSFLMDSAVALLGMAFVGASAMMFDNDIKALKKEGK